MTMTVLRRLGLALLLSGLVNLAAPPVASQQKSAPAQAQSIKKIRSRFPTHGAWGDQSDGTYANPIMPGDFSDLDAIRAGDDFYAITSTFQYSPGIAVLTSRDLVNWRIVGHVVEDLTRISPALNWDVMDRAGRGIWAGSIRYHDAKYWVVFGTPDEGLFVSTADTPLGPWTPVETLLAEPGWDDPCPFWDDDGQGYLVATRFKPDRDGRAYTIHLWKLSADSRHLLGGTDRVIHQSKGSEANKLYKIHGIYYHYFSEVRSEGRVAMMARARSLTGPWEERQLIHVDARVDKEPNQGGLVEVTPDRWYFVTHQGTGDWEGRAGVLLPVTWKDGWPILGHPGDDGIGNMVWRGPKPIDGSPRTSLAASDDFTGETLKPEWEWNYQPDRTQWSLSERPGFLRLHASIPLRPHDLQSTANILTQRAMRTKRSEVTVAFNLSGMTSGQEAGLAHFAKTSATLGIVQDGTTRSLAYTHDGLRQLGLTIEQPLVWIRSTWGYDGMSQFSYSLDGVAFKNFGAPYPLTWGDYRGDRVGLYTFRQSGTGGSIDIDSFRYDLAR